MDNITPKDLISIDAKALTLYIWCPDCIDTDDKEGCWGAENVKVAENLDRVKLLEEMEAQRDKRNGAPFGWEIV